jgi:hypothetical protein
MGGLHITLPMRSDAQEQILAYLRQDRPIEMAYAEPTNVSLPPTKPKPSLAPIKLKPSLAPIKPEPSLASIKPEPLLASTKPELQPATSLAPIKREPHSPTVADDTSFDARFTAVWAGVTNVLGPPAIPWTGHSYAGVLN